LPGESGGGHAKNWFGLHIAQDVAFVGGTDICTQDAQANDNFACYYAGSETGAFIDEPYPGVDTSTTPVFATTRLLLSFDRAFSSHVMAGVRVGFAFGGGPPAGRDVVYQGTNIVQVIDEGLAFFPIHAEARLSYWFGSGVLGKKGLRPYVHAGGGLAQVDAKVGVSVKDCGLYEERGGNFQGCANGTVPANDPTLNASSAELDAWKKLGQGFITLGGGMVYAFTPKLGAQLNLNLMYTLPATGVVIEPSLGAVLGF